MDKKREYIFNTLLALVLAFSLLLTSAGSALAKKDDPLKADPRLLQMAEENPEATFMVIVQKEARNQDVKDTELEDEVFKGGGQVKKQLDLIVSFSAEMTGKEILKLVKHPKVRWVSADAPMASTTTPGMESIRDEFTIQAYTGNNGMAAWDTNWVEAGETTGAKSGSIQVVSHSACAGGSGNCLRIDPNLPSGSYVYRQANLSGFVSVWLTFYRNNLLNAYSGSISEQVQLQISPNGGASWTTLATYSGKSNIGAATDSFDISAYASPNTRIRFLVPTYQMGSRYIYFDNIEILFARPSAFLSTVGADQLGLNGEGVTVAVIDSGIAAFHSDFMAGNSSRVAAQYAFGGNGGFQDLHGHGTHVAGILGGSGAASSGKYRGMAPGVNLINLRVSDRSGMTYESSVVESLQWVYNNKDQYNIRVVNLSMNSTVAQSYHTSPLDAAVEILWFNGIVVVVAAGNNGTGQGPVTVFPPANDPFVITVGATEDKGTSELWDDSLAVFSAYGTTGDGFVKPELVAPGRNLIAPLSDKASTAFTDHPFHRVGDQYFRMSGTSMAAPVVSGAVALLLQSEPDLTPDQVKYRLMATANYAWCGYISLDYQVFTLDGEIVMNPSCDTGYLDAYSAVNNLIIENANQDILPSLMLTTGEEAIDFGTVGWNTVGWNTVGWNSVGWNSVGWNSVGWNSVGWNSTTWDD